MKKRQKKEDEKLVLMGTFEEMTQQLEQELIENYGIDPTAAVMLCELQNQLSPELLEFLIGMLQGFENSYQRMIAQCILDFADDQILRVTGYTSVDAVLTNCYSWIATEKCYKAENAKINY